MKTDELREKYLAFFESKGHTRRGSDVLVPTWDPSVLFTPAGMNQFKDHFLGKVKLEFTRATTCQKCLRTGDIENVGRTAYHHTFFEMLGNFSFGDYFKREAIDWAWEFCTDKKWLGIDPARLTVSVYLDDDEAANIWTEEIGLPSNRIERMGEGDNFWPASAPSEGPDGVCGPVQRDLLSRQFRRDGRDLEPGLHAVQSRGRSARQSASACRAATSTRAWDWSGRRRRCRACRRTTTSTFCVRWSRRRPMSAGARTIRKSESGRRFRRIADHVRACTFAVHENVYPGAKAEKYVIRRLLRRAVLDGHQLGVEEPFLLPAGAGRRRDDGRAVSGTARHGGTRGAGHSAGGAVLLRHDRCGLARVEGIFAAMAKDGRILVDGNDAAELYSTYGIPPELVESLAAERNYTFDTEGFRQAMIKHGLDSGKQQIELFKTGPIEALEEGHPSHALPGLRNGIVAGGNQGHHRAAPTVRSGQRSGTCATDHGRARPDSLLWRVGWPGRRHRRDRWREGFRFRVADTQKDGDLMLHVGHLLSGEMRAGATVTARVDAAHRAAIRRAHSATHILHYALQKNLGRHAQQQGSKVDRDWLRFDFTNLSAVGDEQLRQIEQDVQRTHSGGREPVAWDYVPLAEAREKGAMMLFGEKYPDPVRLVTMGEFSRELCGGTHVSNTRDVEEFEIISEESVSTGTRRVVALTGDRASEQAQQTRITLDQSGPACWALPPWRCPRRCGRNRECCAICASSCRPGRSRRRRRPSKHPEAASPRHPRPTSNCAARLREAARMLNVAAMDVPERTAALLAEVAQLKARVAELSRSGLLSADALIERGEWSTACTSSSAKRPARIRT